MRRNDSTKELVSNGPRRPGQMEWHNEQCQIADYGILQHSNPPYRCIWCATHGQWAHEMPVKHIYMFQNNDTVVTEIR